MPTYSADLLALHAELTRLRAAVPGGGRMDGVMRDLGMIVSRLALDHGAVGAIDADPVAAVETVVSLALAAGADWDRLVAAVSRARPRRV